MIDEDHEWAYREGQVDMLEMVLLELKCQRIIHWTKRQYARAAGIEQVIDVLKEKLGTTKTARASISDRVAPKETADTTSIPLCPHCEDKGYARPPYSVVEISCPHCTGQDRTG